MRINQAPSNGYEDIVGSQTTYRMLNNKWTTVYYEDNVANTNVPGGTSQLARYLLKQEPANVTFIVSRASTQQFETLATTVQRRRKDIKPPMLLSSRLVSGARNMLVAFRASAGMSKSVFVHSVNLRSSVRRVFTFLFPTLLHNHNRRE